MLSSTSEERTFLAVLIEGRTQGKKGRQAQKIITDSISNAANMMVPGNKNKLKIECDGCALYVTNTNDGLLVLDIDDLLEHLARYIDNEEQHMLSSKQ